MIVTSICGAASDGQLLEEVHKRLAELEALHGDYRLISISHTVSTHKAEPGLLYEQWTAFITAEVEKNSGKDGDHAEAGLIFDSTQGGGVVYPSDSGRIEWGSRADLY